MTAAVTLDTWEEETPAAPDPELVDIARRSVHTPLVEAQETLPVLLDMLLERGLLAPVDHYRHEYAEAEERSAARARGACLRDAYEWGHEALGGTAYDLERYDTLRNLTYDSTKKRAQDYRCDVVHPAPNELFVDIDNRQALEVFDRNLEVLRRHVPVEKVEISTSKSGGERRHVVVTLGHVVTSIERIAMQAALGSDPMREMLSIARVFENQEHPTVFFERKGLVREPYEREAPAPVVAVAVLPTEPERDVPPSGQQHSKETTK